MIQLNVIYILVFEKCGDYQFCQISSELLNKYELNICGIEIRSIRYIIHIKC